MSCTYIRSSVHPSGKSLIFWQLLPPSLRRLFMRHNLCASAALLQHRFSRHTRECSRNYQDRLLSLLPATVVRRKKLFITHKKQLKWRGTTNTGLLLCCELHLCFAFAAKMQSMTCKPQSVKSRGPASFANAHRLARQDVSLAPALHTHTHTKGFELRTFTGRKCVKIRNYKNRLVGSEFKILRGA